MLLPHLHGRLILLLRILDLVNLFLHLMMRVPQLSTLLLLVDELSEQQVSVILLRQVLDLQLLILLRQNPVVIIDVLRHLCHGFQMLVELLLLLLVVVLVIFLLFSLYPEHVFDVQQLLVQFLPQLASLVLEYMSQLVLSNIDLLIKPISPLVNKLDVLMRISFKHTSVVLLQLFHSLNLLALLLVVDVDTFEQVLVFGLLLHDV